MGKIFIAFAGKKPDESEGILRLSPAIEYWNLQKLDFDTFVNLVKKVIHPVNDNVTDDRYAQDIWKCDVSQLYQKEASFGLLLPTPATDRNFGYDYEVLHALNLFSPAFLYPIIHVDDLGCWATPHLHTSKEYGQTSHDQPDLSGHFRAKNFVEYFEKIFGALDYFWRNRDREESWKAVDWRLCWAHTLFGDLRRYQNTGKRQGTFLKECLDLCVILESLFSDQKEENISSKLRYRTAALLGSLQKDTETMVKKLYGLRSDYVHGEVFRTMKGFDDGSPTSEHFSFLAKSTTYVRYLLIAYTYLSIHHADFGIEDGGLVPLLESAILDCALRKKIQEKAGEILYLLPTD